VKITQFLDQQRKKHKVTQGKMAAVLGISIQAYRRRLRGDGFADSEIEIMAKMFDVQIQLIPKDQIV
jgi:transcriptional regulator with XRE-family HTH domain